MADYLCQSSGNMDTSENSSANWLAQDWQTKTERLCQRGRYLLESGIWSDCKFIVGSDTNQRVFHSHKLILSMASPVFATMFNASFQEMEAADVKILDVQPDAFASLLKYVYTDDLTIESFDQACELCYVANKYMMPLLVKNCSSYIWKDVSPSNACRAYEFALLFDQDTLMRKCKQIICTETEAVFKSNYFTDMELSTLHMILDQDELFITNENILFTAVVCWASQEFQRRGIAGEENIKEQRELAEPLLAKIRFLLMTATEFAEGPAQSTLLTQDQKFAILMNISSAAAGVPMPAAFSTEKAHRNYQVKHQMCHFLCKPDLVKNNVAKNIGLIESSLIFSCDRDIKIYGVQMLAQCAKLEQTQGSFNSVSHPSGMMKYGESAWRAERPAKYRENLYIYMEEVVQGEACNGWVPISGKIENNCFKEIVEYGDTIEVKFQRPGRASKGRHYKIAIGMNVPGNYAKWTLKNPSTNSHNNLFSFYVSDYYDCYDNGIFFHAIIYNY